MIAAFFMLNSQEDVPDLAMLNIDSFLKSIGTGEGLVAETDEDGTEGIEIGGFEGTYNDEYIQGNIGSAKQCDR
jgi:hypothetical protein